MLLLRKACWYDIVIRFIKALRLRCCQIVSTILNDRALSTRLNVLKVLYQAAFIDVLLRRWFIALIEVILLFLISVGSRFGGHHVVAALHRNDVVTVVLLVYLRDHVVAVLLWYVAEVIDGRLPRQRVVVLPITVRIIKAVGHLLLHPLDIIRNYGTLIIHLLTRIDLYLIKSLIIKLGTRILLRQSLSLFDLLI